MTLLPNRLEERSTSYQKTPIGYNHIIVKKNRKGIVIDAHYNWGKKDLRTFKPRRWV